MNERLFLSEEEIQALTFLNSVLEQHEEQLSNQISMDRFTVNEQMAGKLKKHKSEIQKVQAEKAEYEARANAMCTQMGEQMVLLQQTAMARIGSLESELLEERKKNDIALSEIRQLKLTASIKDIKRSNRERAESDSGGNSNGNDDEDDGDGDDCDDGNSSEGTNERCSVNDDDDDDDDDECSGDS